MLGGRRGPIGEDVSSWSRRVSGLGGVYLDGCDGAVDVAQAHVLLAQRLNHVDDVNVGVKLLFEEVRSVEDW